MSKLPIKKTITTAYLPDDQMMRIRHLAVSLKKPISTVISEALTDYEKKKLRQIKK